MKRPPASTVLDLPPDDTLLSEARLLVKANLERGSQCLCCGQFAKIYRRRFNRNQAEGLIEFYKSCKRVGMEKFIHVYDAIPGKYMRGGDFAKSKHWRLIETINQQRPDGCERNGFWRMTKRGIAFVNNELRVQSHEFLYGEEFLGLDGPLVSIIQCMGKGQQFNYAELMRGA